MKLYEFEGHKILSRVGIEVPFFVTCQDLDEVEQARKRLKFPLIAKVQVLSGKRGKSGGVKKVSNDKQLLAFAKEMFGKEFSDEQIRFINLAERVAIEKEYYASITYDTVLRIPFLLFSFEGGVDIEEVKAHSPEKIIRVDIDPVVGLVEKEIKKLIGKDCDLVDFLMRLWDAFVRFDCRLVEVNPIAKVKRTFYSSSEPFGQTQDKLRESRSSSRQARTITGDDSYVALDAKVILDDNGLLRHRDLDVLPKGAIGAIAPNREVEAKKIDAEDYRGSAGSTFIEFDGDIAILASGGGASLLVIDSVFAAGGRPANYTEYSGNPPAEKVERLTEITLSRDGLNGCLVAGAVANFTDIYETLSGFVKGLKKIKPEPTYPVVIRRGGPRQKEAYEMLEKFAKKEGFDVHLFGPETPISVACRKMVELTEKFKKLNIKNKN